ncbi:penicillin-insensitive murein endopeptidase [Blastochloris viridis]|uniref:Murein endopeptidase n=1 Tax=Blastochloris viridis TaxID=1079 RepID=A0A0H5BAJ4_BLAVI|nr:penicillin-insensitive murein endopeptidase [Blastochloris viridis]ALK10750.1 Penicillin-insensitive murein endopeptidase precursor [Blastochloris viridis]BAR99282.1 murein endopeptidase [Blastochloris viridis]CUU43412.1 Penicillin-insensitive murein endopeptidase precursor [Blastochloris viridis]
MPARLVFVLALAAVLGGSAGAQTPGTLAPAPLPPLADPDDPKLAAKELFGRALVPSPAPPRAIGGFARGCLAGAAALPADGTTWQVMRPSRNRSFGHPRLIAFIERLAQTVPAAVGWPGLLIGDLSQPRGGPMLTGHGSHQIGLDADIWLTPMPAHTLSREDRETMSATNVVAADWNDVDPAVWTARHRAFIRLAALQPEVSRVFANPAIKKALCREAGADRAWLAKVRPWRGHNYHVHIRLSCPPGAADCKDQGHVPAGDGCGADLAWWFSAAARKPKPPAPPSPPLTLQDLPPACRDMLAAK